MTLALFLALGMLFQAGSTQPSPVLPDAEGTYALGPDDQIIVRAVDVEEIDNKPVRIAMSGNIDLPLVGRIHAGGLTLDQLKAEIESRLNKFLNQPEVSVSVMEMRSQPVSVLGAVQTPGIHQLQGQKTLFEVLSLAGGLRSDAGNTVKITRKMEWGRIPLPSAVDNGQFSVATLSVKGIMTAARPEENITIRPYDVISVPTADIIYVIGAVHKSGGFVLGENESLSALQVLSLAEGLERAAAPENAKVMRLIENSSNRSEIPVDLKRVLAGKGTDLPLKADDILFIPTSATKNAALRSLEAAIQIGTGVAIYHR